MPTWRGNAELVYAPWSLLHVHTFLKSAGLGSCTILLLFLLWIGSVKTCNRQGRSNIFIVVAAVLSNSWTASLCLGTEVKPSVESQDHAYTTSVGPAHREYMLKCAELRRELAEKKGQVEPLEKYQDAVLDGVVRQARLLPQDKWQALVDRLLALHKPMRDTGACEYNLTQCCKHW